MSERAEWAKRRLDAVVASWDDPEPFYRQRSVREPLRSVETP